MKEEGEKTADCVYSVCIIVIQLKFECFNGLKIGCRLVGALNEISNDSALFTKISMQCCVKFIINVSV